MRLAIVGGSDAGISAALRARELDPSTGGDGIGSAVALIAAIAGWFGLS